MEIRKKLSMLALLAMTAMFGLSACNTMKGAGQDIEKAGSKIEQKAKDAQD